MLVVVDCGGRQYCWPVVVVKVVGEGHAGDGNVDLCQWWWIVDSEQW
jgi:hypothetical protein